MHFLSEQRRSPQFQTKPALKFHAAIFFCQCKQFQGTLKWLISFINSPGGCLPACFSRKAAMFCFLGGEAACFSCSYRTNKLNASRSERASAEEAV